MSFSIPARALLLLPLLLPRALGASWSPWAYPNPNTDVYQCGRRGVPSWVCDPDGVIPYESANVVEGVIKEIHAGRSPYALGPCGQAGPQGYQVAVALMRRMQASGDLVAAAKSFATVLHDRWGVGDRRCSNGVVFLLSSDDRQMYVSAGAGNTSLLTHAVLSSILADVRPLLKAQRYGEAVERAVVDIGLALAGRPVQPQANRWPVTTESLRASLLWVALAVGIVWLAVFSARKQAAQRNRHDDCKSKLEKIKRDHAALRAGSPYNPTFCPVCLEDFTPEPSSPGGGNGGTVTNNGRNRNNSNGNGNGRGKSIVFELRMPLLGHGGVGVGGGAVAAASAAGRGGAGGEAGPPPQRRLTLQCGHAFCRPCITKWLDQKNLTCPICRRPIDEEAARAASAPPLMCPRQLPRYGWGLCSGGRCGGCGTCGGCGGRCCGVRMAMMGGDPWLTETAFRLRQLQRQYPDYISDSLASGWEADLYAGRGISSAQLPPDPPVHNPDPARSDLESSGARGNSVGFGGGSSSGGGGLGGSW